MDISVFCLLLAGLLVIATISVAWINRNKPACPEENEQEAE